MLTRYICVNIKYIRNIYIYIYIIVYNIYIYFLYIYYLNNKTVLIVRIQGFVSK